jgi:putative transposase
MNIQIKEKHHRLNKSFYIGRVIVCFTLCINQKKEVFKDKKIVSVFKNILYDTASTYGFNLPVFLFMPDHLHLILYGKNEDSDCLKMVNMFKQKTGYWLLQNKIVFRWQKDYYDHIIKHENDLHNQMFYVLNNPVRAGIVDNWYDILSKVRQCLI